MISITSHPLLFQILERPPITPFSPLFSPLSTPSSGLSIFASSSLAPLTHLHTSGLPSASVVVKRWRKEVCEICHELMTSPGEGEKERGRKGETVRWFCGTECQENWRSLYGEEGIECVRIFEESLERIRKGRNKSESRSRSRLGSGTGTPNDRTETGEQDIIAGIEKGLREVLLRAGMEGEEARPEEAMTEDQVESQLRRATQTHSFLLSQPSLSRPSTPTTEGHSYSRKRTESPKSILRHLDLSSHLVESDDQDLLRFLLDGLLKKMALSLHSPPSSLATSSSSSILPESWTSVRSLVPSLPYFSPRPQRSAQFFTPEETFDSHLRLYYFLLSTFRSSALFLPHLTPTNIFLLLARDRTNSFGSYGGKSFSISQEQDDGGMGELHGYSLLPSSSYFNHSCRPNVSKKRSGARWIFEVMSGGHVEKGEELCISYLGEEGEMMEGRERRRKLKGSWGFDCACARCREESGAS